MSSDDNTTTMGLLQYDDDCGDNDAIIALK
jgi:hypothetical protein